MVDRFDTSKFEFLVSDIELEAAEIAFKKWYPEVNRVSQELFELAIIYAMNMHSDFPEEFDEADDLVNEDETFFNVTEEVIDFVNSERRYRGEDIEFWYEEYGQ